MTSLKIKSLLSGLLLALAMVFSAPAMADALDDARAAGLVGERPDGLVASVSPSAPANIQSLVQSVNAQRLEKYQQIANRKGRAGGADRRHRRREDHRQAEARLLLHGFIGHLGHEIGRMDGGDPAQHRGDAHSSAPGQLHRRSQPGDRRVSLAEAQAARCSSKARPGVGKTEIAKVLSATLGRDAGAPAMLRGARRRLRGL